MGGSFKKFVIGVAKFMVGIVALAILVQFGSIDLTVLMKAADRPGFLVIAFLCLLATVPIAALRWWMLLRGLQFSFTLPWAMNTTFVSIFFHTFLPGAYGGDLVRLAMAYRAAGSGLNRLTFSVVIDRLTGLIALLILGLAMLPALPAAYATRFEWVAAIAVATSIAGLVLALRSGDLVARLVERLPAPVGPALASIVREVVAAIRAYLAQPGLLCFVIAISLVQYMLVLGALIVLGKAMQFDGLSLPGYVIAGVWSLVANALPITPGGIGVGEAAFAHVAGALATSSSAGSGFGTVFLAMRILSISIGMVGLLPWIFRRMDLRRGLAAMKTAGTSDKRVAPLAE